MRPATPRPHSEPRKAHVHFAVDENPRAASRNPKLERRSGHHAGRPPGNALPAKPKAADAKFYH